MKKHVIFPVFLATSLIWSSAHAAEILQCSRVHIPALRKSPQVSAQEAEKKYQSFLQELKKSGLTDDFSTPEKRRAALEFAVKVGDPVLLGYLAGHGFKNEFSNPAVDSETNRIHLAHAAMTANRTENVLFILRQIKDPKLILKDNQLWGQIGYGKRHHEDQTVSALFTESEFISIFKILADKKAIPQDAVAQKVSSGFQSSLLNRIHLKYLTPTGFASLVEILAKSGISIKSNKTFGPHALTDTIIHHGGEHSIEFFKILMKYGVGPNQIASEQNLTLFQVALVNNVKLARYLVENGADLHSVLQGHELNALGFLAVNSRHEQQKEVLELAKLLIRKGVSPNLESPSYGFPLIMSMTYGNSKLTDLLWAVTDFSQLRHPGDIVVVAVQKKSKAMLEKIEQKGISINAKSRAGNTALFTAVQFGDLEMVKYLLSKGVSAKGVHSIHGHMMGTALSNHPEIFQLLLEQGADLNTVDSMGRTLFHYLTFTEKLPQDLSFLEKVNVSLDQKDNQGLSALQAAQQRQSKGAKVFYEFIDQRLGTRIKNRVAFKASQEEIVLLLTSALRTMDPSSNKRSLEDLSIEDIISALRYLEKRNVWGEVKLSEIIYDKVKRRDTGVELIRQLFAIERGFKPANSLELFAKVTGLPFEALKNNKYSEKTLGDFFEITLSLQSTTFKPLFENSKVDPQLLANNQLATFGHYLSRIRIVTMVSEVKADRIFSYLPEVTLEKLQEFEIKRLGPIMVQAFKKMFADPNMKFSYEQFMELYQKWGDIEPVMTLLARYNQNESWKKNIPLLVEVFKSSLANEFGEFKFGPKNAKSAEQLKGMSESQIAEWMKPRAKVSLAPKPEMDPKLFEGLRIQVSGDLKSRTTIAPQNGVTGLAQEAMNLKMSPKQIIQKLMTDKGLNQQQVVAQIYSDLVQILLTTKDVTVLRKSVDWLRTLAINEPSLVRNGDMDGFNKTLLGLRQSIEGISSQLAEGPILLSVISHDPKFMLMLGDLVQATSCQNYRTGSVIGTLLGYVTDANVQAMVSYAITEPFFKTPADYKKVQDAISKGQLADTRFDGNKRIVQFSLKSGEVVETQFLGYGYLRNALKLGHRANGAPGIFLERDYAQNHPNLEQLKAQHKELLIEVAKAAHTEINGALSIVGSRSPGGIYSDAGGGQKNGDYSVNIPQLEP